jgi:hypothetical protein
MRYCMEAFKQLRTMAATVIKQIAAMDSLAWRTTHEWNCAKNEQKNMEQMQEVWEYITQSRNYQCLADMRKSTIHYLWRHTRTITLAQNQIHGRWLNGAFYANWCDLPEKYKRDDNLLKTLPCGHFWVDNNRRPTTIRYFISSDCADEDTSHFLASEPILPIVTKG